MNIMRKLALSLITLLLALTGTVRLAAQVPEFLLYDETFVWSESTGGDGCLGFHFWNDLGEGTFTNWKSPYDFQNGQFYFRYEIVDQPELSGGGYETFGISFCIWSDYQGSTWKETCTDVHTFAGPGTVVTHNESPTTWWVHPMGNIDWTDLSKLWRFGNPFWYNSYVLASPTYCAPSSPATLWDDNKDKFFPMTIRMTIVAVAQGQTFSGWDHYLSGTGVNRMPTPTYTINYTNETTTQVVPSSDEYSANSGMSGAASGSGSVVSLTPGTDMYFRTKASGEYLASLVQHLTVPSNPSAPTFSYDVANQRTSTTVSSDYEYSTSSNMSGAISGTGNYVSFAQGTTMYFRKKATASAFKSRIQTLEGASYATIGPEFIILRDTIEYPNTTDDNGFYFFYHDENTMPVNWTTPYDYYHGQVYYRYEIIDQPTTTTMGMQFGIWQKLPDLNGTLYESMAEIKTLNGPGSIVTGNSSPSSYWLYNGGVDYTQMNKVWHFGINPWQLSPTEEQIRSENATVWANRFTYWFPMKAYVIVVAVASGSTFSGWDNYINTEKPATPTYGIDYTNEQTNAAIPISDEYASNSGMTGAVSGTGQKIALTPGQNVYFRVKSANGAPASDVQELVVPARPATPTFAIDYALESTSTSVSSEYEHSVNSDMSSATAGTGAKVVLTPGTNKYFRKKATASSFRSAKQTLVVPARPTIEATVSDTLREALFLVTVNFPGNSAGFALGNMIYKVEPILPGPLTLRIDANATTAGNFASSIFSIYYKANPSGINPLSLSKNLYVYPTPVKEYLNVVTNSDYLPMQIKVMDLNGKTLYQKEQTSVSEKVEMGGLAPGMYMVTFEKNGTASLTKKIVKQ
jgi:hypothetical protein